MTLNLDLLAESAIDRYYDDDITDETTLFEFLDAYPADDDDKTVHARLTDALADDIHDLLKNGNDEDLAWSEAAVTTIREGDYYANLTAICSTIATKLIARIYA